MRVLFIYPGDLQTPTGGYRYDREIMTGLDMPVTTLSLGDGFPEPNERQITRALDLMDRASFHEIVVVDGLAGGAIPQGLARLKGRGMKVVALIHHPLCLETGMPKSSAKKLEESERMGLEHVAHVITTSENTKQSVADLFQFPLNKITAILPGVERGPMSKGWKRGPVHLVCVASITPRKAHLDLIRALSQLDDLDWRLTCVGPDTLDIAYAEHTKTAVINAGLGERVRFTGSVEPDTLEQIYASAHLFVLASHYEGYGMVFSEAIVRGLPVVATTGGAVPKTVPDGCGLLVKPGDVQALANALREAITDHSKRNAMRETCLREHKRFPQWDTVTKQFADTLRQVA